MLLEVAFGAAVAVNQSELDQISAQARLLQRLPLRAGERSLARIRLAGDGMLSSAAPLGALEEQSFEASARTGTHYPDQRFQTHAARV